LAYPFFLLFSSSFSLLGLCLINRRRHLNSGDGDAPQEKQQQAKDDDDQVSRVGSEAKKRKKGQRDEEKRKTRRRNIEATGSSAKVNGLCPSIRAALLLLLFFFPHSKFSSFSSPSQSSVNS
jgi:hypothetical protein